VTAFKEQVDAVVIGSGAGGAPVAAVLAEAGASVVVLEKGPYYTSQDFVHDEIKLCRRDFWIPFTHEDPHVIVNGDRPPRRSREGWTSQCVGGATVHMSGFFYRLKESDLRLKTLTGGVADSTVADWPLAIEDLLPYYDLMEARIGVSGRAGINPFETRSRPFPLPPIAVHPSARLFDEAARGLGHHPFPTPRAIVSRSYGRRPPCNLCGLCGDYGCENASKSSTLVTLIPDAEATGRCQIRARCMASRILVDEQDRVQGVEYLDQDGRANAIGARVVVVAASAIESARLLLLSGGGRFPEGLGNRNGLVGKNLTFSTFGKGTAIFDRGELQAALGADGMDLPFFSRSVQDDYWNEGLGVSLPKGGTYNYLLHHPNLINAAIRLAMDEKWMIWGEELKERIRRHFVEELMVEFEVFGEYLPTERGYVELDPETRDRWGLPVARFHVFNHPACNEVNRVMVRRGMDIFEAMKPAPKKVFPWTWASTTLHLQHGTCRFGTDPATSVLDPSCQSHEVKNLYVTDGSFMPTSGAVPATPTILANSFRVGHILRERFLKREI